MALFLLLGTGTWRFQLAECTPQCFQPGHKVGTDVRPDRAQMVAQPNSPTAQQPNRDTVKPFRP